MKEMFKRINSWKIFFVLIFFLAAFLRLYGLDRIPSGFARDEASVGYNAYSILKTGKDEHGKILPLAFEAFGDWKLPLNIYFAVPFITLFDLNVFSVRLSVAFFGILSVIAVFFLCEELRKKYLSASVWFSIMASLLLAVSSWHIYMSRTGFGHNVIALFFFLLGLTFFLRSLRIKQGLILSMFFFGATLLTYTSYHIFLPLFIAGLVFIYNKDLFFLKNFKKAILIFLLIFCFSQIVLWKANITKIPGSSLLSDANMIYSRIERKQNEHEEVGFYVKIFHNKLTAVFNQISINYLSVFSSQFMFNKGGENLINNIEEMGNYYVLDALLLVIGLYFLIKQKSLYALWLLLLWLFLSPLPGAFTKDAPHSTRTFTMIGATVLIEAFALSELLIRLNKPVVRAVFLILFSLYSLGVLLFLELYFLHFPLNRARYWAYGYKEISEIIQNNPAKRVVLSKIFDSPYIFLLFFHKYDPVRFQAEAKRTPPTWDGFRHVVGFDKYRFVEGFDWNHAWDFSNTLYFDAAETVPKGYPVSGWVRYPAGDKAFGWLMTIGDPCMIIYPEKELIPKTCR